MSLRGTKEPDSAEQWWAGAGAWPWSWGLCCSEPLPGSVLDPRKLPTYPRPLSCFYAQRRAELSRWPCLQLSQGRRVSRDHPADTPTASSPRGIGDRDAELRTGRKPEMPVRCAGRGSGEHTGFCFSQPLWDHKNPACSALLPCPRF